DSLITVGPPENEGGLEGSSSGSINGITPQSIYLSLYDLTGTAFSSSMLPNAITFSAFDGGAIGLVTGSGPGYGTTIAPIISTGTSIAIPISLSGQMALTGATEHLTLADSTSVATFSDSNNTDQASDFTASIDWGDGQTTSGIVSGRNGSFTVSGGHT